MIVSSVTKDLQVKVLATLKVIDNPHRYECSGCVKRFNKKQRERMGCFGGDQITATLGSRGEYKLTKCPGNFYDESAAYMYELFHLFQQGNLPFPGTVTEQPAQLMEVFSVIGQIEKSKEERKAKKNGR